MRKMPEIHVRVKKLVKEKLDEIKNKYGLSINYLVNFCLIKFLVIERFVAPYEVRKMKEEEDKE